MKANLGDGLRARERANSSRFPLTAWPALLLSFAVGFSPASASEGDAGASDSAAVLARIPVGASESDIGLIADIPNLEPQGPAAIAVNPQTSDGFVLDTVNGRVVQVLPPTPDGEALPSLDLASDDPTRDVGHGTDLVFANDAFYVLDGIGRKVVKYDTEGEWAETFQITNPKIRLGGSATLLVLANDDIRIREAGVKELPIDMDAARGAHSADGALSTATEGGVVSSKSEWGAGGSSVQLALRSPGDGAGRAISQTIDVKTQAALASVELIGVDGSGRFYVLATELGEEGMIRTSLARYTAAGKLEDVANVPVDDVVHLPNRFLALDNKGTAYFLQPLSTEVLVIELAFKPRDDLSAPADAAYERRSKATTLIVDEDFLKAVETASKDEPYEVPRGKISRDQVLENAYAFLHLEWTMSPGNYGRSAQNNCRSPKNWRRPVRLNGKLGKQVRAAPYKWGGFQSTTSVEGKLAQSLVAGDICTCRKKSRGYCISSGTTGVDCSGFVSQSLGEKYHTTSGMSAITKPLNGLRSLKKGDILNRAGRHVRLVAEDAPQSGPLVIKTIESAVSCGGVCEAVYTAAKLAKYKPLRYRHIQEVTEAAPPEKGKDEIAEPSGEEETAGPIQTLRDLFGL